MKKSLLLPILGVAVATVTGGALTTYADQTISDGTTTGTVPINGTLGMDNKDETSTIVEGSDQWINVTIPTTTIFYNTAGSSTIEAPKYTVTNNSGRPVDVTVSGISQTNSVDISSIATLNVTFTRDSTTATTPLITTGTLATDFSSASAIRIANTNGKLLSTDAASAASKTATFTYAGTVSPVVSSVLKPTFNMTLKFAAVSWS